MNQEGPQVDFPGFTSELQQEQNPEPCKPGDTQPSQPTFPLSQGSLPCREEALEKELDAWEWKRNDQDFLQKSLLRYSGESNHLALPFHQH